MSRKQLGFILDQTRCIGCQACETNCKVVWDLPRGVRYRRVIARAFSETPAAQREYVSMACNHCSDPVCAKVCPAGAIVKREQDGIVVQDPAKCIGCQYCLRVCPYQAPQFNETVGKVQKCNFCQPLLDSGRQPACVQGCPTKALTYGDISEFDAKYPAVAAATPNVLDTNPSLRVKGGKAGHVTPEDETQPSPGVFQGEIMERFQERTGVHWWLNVARPGGKVVMGAAAVAAGGSLVMAMAKEGGKKGDGE